MSTDFSPTEDNDINNSYYLVTCFKSQRLIDHDS